MKQENDIDTILERYFEGESTLEDEKTLKIYFKDGNIKEHHKIYAPMFRYFDEEEPSLPTTQKESMPRSNTYIWGAVAACILTLLLAIGALIGDKQQMGASQSVVYIDGKKISKIDIINSQVLSTLEEIDDIDENIIDTQIDILESFTDN